LSSGRNLMAAAMTGTLGLAYIIGLGVYLVSSVSRASRTLDPVLSPYGLTSERHMLVGRRYRGLLQGRQTEILFTPSRGIQPALLQVTVSAGAGTRAAIGIQRPLLDCQACERVQMEELGMSHLQIYAEDTRWIRRLLAAAANRTAVDHALSDQRALGFRELYIQPEQVWLRARPPAQVNQDVFEQWLDDLLALAEGIDEVSAAVRSESDLPSTSNPPGTGSCFPSR
jgi:hypothetical protein